MSTKSLIIDLMADNNINIIDKVSSMNEEDFTNVLNILDDYYYNDEPLVNDNIYDTLLDIYQNKYGEYLFEGAEPRGEKVELPYYLGSLTKVKEEVKLNRFLREYPGPYILEDKIDGMTILLVSKMIQGRRVVSLYTKGRGIKGKDVSYLTKYIKLPQLNIDISVRGELMLTKEAFNRIGKDKKAARNYVSGITNRKRSFNPEDAKELSFYAFRIMSQNNIPEEDVNILMSLGFLVPNPVFTDSLTKEILEDYYKLRKEQAPYDIDGLVIYQNVYEEYPEGKEPKHVIAFKMGSDNVVRTVLKVDWKASKDRILNPVVEYEPIYLSGANLSHASAHNAEYVVSKGIGPGAKVLITRSGEIIPYILDVIISVEPSLPDPKIHGEYTWNDTGKKFILLEDNDDVRTKKILYFLKNIGIKGIGSERVSSFVHNRIDSIDKLLRVTSEQLMNIEGMGSKLSNQLVNDLKEKVSNVPLSIIMTASGIFSGFKEKSFDKIIEVYPNLLDYISLPREELANAIRNIHGFADKADVIAEKLPLFVYWLKQNPMIKIENVKEVVKTSDLAGINVVFTGPRNKELEEKIKLAGGKIGSAVSRNTSYVIMEEILPEYMKGKAEKSQSLGIPIITMQQFIDKYF